MFTSTSANEKPVAIRWILLTLVSFTLFEQSAQAAFCSLRDPVSAIQHLYPESDRYLSLVRPVRQEARDQIGQKLPFSLHFNEIGQHTLFVALIDKQAVGFVHARSELSDWGIIELAWAINLDMTVEGFYFQRCRSPRCNTELVAKISDEVRGKSFDEILPLLEAGRAGRAQSSAEAYGEDAALELSVVRSALKTLAVTEISWEEDIARIRRDAVARQNLPSSEALELRQLIVSQDLGSNQHVDSQGPGSMITRESIQVHLVLKDGREVGRLVEAGWRQGADHGDLLWLFSPQGDLLDVQSMRKWQNEEISSAFGQLIGQRFSDGRNCASATEVVGNTLFQAGFRSGGAGAQP